jgi:hypothetical protein
VEKSVPYMPKNMVIYIYTAAVILQYYMHFTITLLINTIINAAMNFLSRVTPSTTDFNFLLPFPQVPHTSFAISNNVKYHYTALKI